MTDQSSRLPPHNLEAETSVLAAAVLDNASLDESAGLVTPADFYLQSNRVLFASMLELRNADKPVDMITLIDHLQATDRLEAVGGHAGVADLAGRISTAANVGYWAAIVAEKSRLRGLIATAYQLASDAFDNPPDVDKFMDEAEGKILALNRAGAADNARDGRAVAHAAFSQIEALAGRSDDLSGMPSGYADLDALTCGFQPGDLVILAARPGQGKTALALNTIVRAAGLGRGRVLFFSLEMTAEALGVRMISTASRISHQSLRKGQIFKNHWTPLAAAAQKISECDMVIDDTPDLSIGQLRARARREHHRRPLGMIVVDYLQLVRGSEKRKEANREQEIAEISRGLKALAKQLRIPVLALAQLNRKIEERSGEPRLSDLRESGAIEQDADTIMFLHQPPLGGANEDHLNHQAAGQQEGEYIKLIIRKHRNGPTGDVRLVLFPDTVRFESFAGNYAADGLAASVTLDPRVSP